MNANSPFDTLDIENLLKHLCLSGIPVGNIERQRLKNVFESNPQLEREAFKQLLHALLAKNAQQRHLINQIFPQYVPNDIHENQTPEEHTLTTAKPSNKQAAALQANFSENITKEKKRVVNYWQRGILISLILILAFIGFKYFAQKELKDAQQATRIDAPSGPPKTGKEATINQEQQAALKLETHVTLWKPEIVHIAPYDIWSKTIAPMALLIASLLSLAWLWQKAKDKTQRAQAAPITIKARGERWIPPLKQQSEYHLLSRKERSEISWGAYQRLSDFTLPQLDVPKTVAASAKNGIPSIHFQRIHHEREIWLWQDRSSKNPNLKRLAKETQKTLQRINLPLRLGYFQAIPDTVTDQYGKILWSLRHENPEHSPIVIILSDYESLLRTPEEQLTKTQKKLSRWKSLCFVDCSQQTHSLCRYLNHASVDCITPTQLANWLSHQGQRQQRQTLPSCKLDDLHRWNIACSLAERPISEAEIRKLHDELTLQCGWQFDDLIRRARPIGQAYDFSENCIALRQEFADIQHHKTDPAFIHNTLHFWRKRYQDIDQTHLDDKDAKQPWEDSLRQHKLHLDWALLELWQPKEITETVKTLFNLHQYQSPEKRHLRPDVERKLSRYQPQDWLHNVNTISLPFQWQDLNAKTQQRLKTMGLGGNPEIIPLTWNSSTSLLMGFLAGLALISLSLIAYAFMPLLMPQANTVKTLANSAEPTHYVKKQNGNTFIIGHAKTGSYQGAQVPDNNATVHVRWEAARGEAAQAIVDKKYGTELWRLGTQKVSSMLGITHEHSKQIQQWAKNIDSKIAVIEDNPTDLDARKLAAFLLDTGSADQVILGKHWKRIQRRIAQQLGNHLSSQWLYINTHEHEAVEGTHTAWFDLNSKELLTKLQNKNQLYQPEELSGETLKGTPKLIGNDKAAYLPTLEFAHDLTLQLIPKGSFQMGSNKYDMEKPVHTVTFAQAFYMSQTEITFAQYSEYAQQSGKTIPDDENWGRDNRPVINVSWNDTQGYSEWLSKELGQSCRLPTEAEWEYAARAGSTTHYAWGDEVGKNNANCRDCGSEWYGKQTAPVGSFRPNAFGLYDMHGNVWEWVQDRWHDNYQEAPIDGSAWGAGENQNRVLRGGSRDDFADILRSAYRFGNFPDSRDDNIGFRVVCGLPSAER